MAARSIGPPELELTLSIPGSTDAEEVALLYELARRTTRGCIVEVGSGRGRSTVALALGSKGGAGLPVYAVEPHEHFRGVLGGAFTPANRATFMESVLRSGTVEVVRLINLSSEVVAPGWGEEVGLVFIDGDHRVEAARRDFACWGPHLVTGGLAVLHDSTDPALGPYRVVEAAVGTGEYATVEVVSRATVLRKVGVAARGNK